MSQMPRTRRDPGPRADAAPDPAYRERLSAGLAAGSLLLDRLRHSPAGRELGTLPGRLGVCLVAAGAALGGFITLVAHSVPGPVLGVFLVLGTIAAALAVRPRDAYMVIPVPALAYVITAMTVGLIETFNQPGTTSLTTLAVNVLQWIASGFLAMLLATLAALAATVIHWLRRPASPR
jgi:hypothetical protein